jgi:hypothetical protein
VVVATGIKVEVGGTRVGGAVSSTEILPPVGEALAIVGESVGSPCESEGLVAEGAKTAVNVKLGVGVRKREGEGSGAEVSPFSPPRKVQAKRENPTTSTRNFNLFLFSLGICLLQESIIYFLHYICYFQSVLKN